MICAPNVVVVEDRAFVDEGIPLTSDLGVPIASTPDGMRLVVARHAVATGRPDPARAYSVSTDSTARDRWVSRDVAAYDAARRRVHRADQPGVGGRPQGLGDQSMVAPDFVDRLVTDPADPPAVVMFVGFTGRASPTRSASTSTPNSPGSSTSRPRTCCTQPSRRRIRHSAGSSCRRGGTTGSCARSRTAPAASLRKAVHDATTAPTTWPGARQRATRCPATETARHDRGPASPRSPDVPSAGSVRRRRRREIPAPAGVARPARLAGAETSNGQRVRHQHDQVDGDVDHDEASGEEDHSQEASGEQDHLQEATSEGGRRIDSQDHGGAVIDPSTRDGRDNGREVLTSVASHRRAGSRMGRRRQGSRRELREVQNKAAGRLPRDTYARRLAAAPTDVASLLQVHLGYLEDVNSDRTLNAGYEKAITQYTKRVELWEEEGGQKQAARTSPVHRAAQGTDVRRGRRPTRWRRPGPRSAMSQLASAVRPR